VFNVFNNKVRRRFHGWMHSKSKQHQIHLSCWMEVRSRFKGWMHSTIQELSNTSFIFCMEVRCRFNGKSKKCQIHLPFGMEVRSRFKGWMHSKIKEMLNTMFDGSPMSLQQVGAFKHPKKTNTCFMLDGSPKSLERLDAFKNKKKFKIHISLWMEV
jgi:hypothetical protein